MSEKIAAENPKLAERLFDATAQPFAVHVLNEKRKITRFKIGRAIGPKLAARAAEDLEPHVPWTARFLRTRYDAYRESGHPLEATAWKDLQTFMDAAPRSIDAKDAKDAAPKQGL